MGVKKKPNNPKNFGKTSHRPRRPFEKERLDSELKTIGTYALKNKRELWRVQLTLAKIRKHACHLLTLQPDNPKRVFEGAAMLRRLTRLGILNQDQQSIEECLSLKTEQFLKRRLQTLLKENSIVLSPHRGRVLIYQRHIRVGNQTVTSASFLVRKKNEGLINFRDGSSLAGGPPGKIKRRNMIRKKKAAELQQNQE